MKQPDTVSSGHGAKSRGNRHSSFLLRIREAVAGSQQKFTEGSIGRAILLLSIPMVLELVMEPVFAVVEEECNALALQEMLKHFTPYVFYRKGGETSMATVKIWHNPRCSKSRTGLERLKQKGCDLEVFEYTKEAIDPKELARVIQMSDQPLHEFIRTNEQEYRALGLHDKELTVDEFAELAAKHPKLLQRPIVIKGDKAVVARPIAKIDDLF